jgi:hypothetical protein
LSPLRFGLPLFSSEVFILSPLCFGVSYFFIGGLCFEPMTEGCNNAPLFLALAFLAYQVVKYRASVASNFDDGDQCFGE